MVQRQEWCSAQCMHDETPARSRKLLKIVCEQAGGARSTLLPVQGCRCVTSSSMQTCAHVCWSCSAALSAAHVCMHATAACALCAPSRTETFVLASAKFKILMKLHHAQATQSTSPARRVRPGAFVAFNELHACACMCGVIYSFHSFKTTSFKSDI